MMELTFNNTAPNSSLSDPLTSPHFFFDAGHPWLYSGWGSETGYLAGFRHSARPPDFDNSDYT